MGSFTYYESHYAHGTSLYLAGESERREAGLFEIALEAGGWRMEHGEQNTDKGRKIKDKSKSISARSTKEKGSA